MVRATQRATPASHRTVDHVGEWKLELRAPSIEALFVELARALADAAGSPSCGSPSGAWERIELVARDHATLLIDWANELIGRSETAGMAYGDVRELIIAPAAGNSLRLTADVRGAPVVAWISPVKAATYHDVGVRREGDEWRAVVLLDV